MYANQHKNACLKQQAMLKGNIVEQEEMVLKADKHVEMAQKQRLMYQIKCKEYSVTAAKSPQDKVRCFVADYSQYHAVPIFASKQPGDTYFFSHCNCYFFGMVDCSVVPLKLTAMMYTNDVGKKEATMFHHRVGSISKGLVYSIHLNHTKRLSL